MVTDIRDELDRSFGSGPAHRPLEIQVERGQRALRRRRALVAAVATGIVVVVGGSYAVAASGPARDTRGEVAVQPTGTPTTEPTSGPSEPAWQGNDPVRYLDGALQVRPGVTVHEHLENPFGYDAPELSDGLDLTFRGQRSWVLVELTADGPTSTSTVPNNGWATFGDWVAAQVASAQGGHSGSGWPDTMRLTDDFRVVAVPGAEVLQRTDDPQLGESFAPPGATAGAALVRPAGEQQAYFVVWRVIDGELDVITTPPRDVVGATFDELLSYARGQYANGEGLR